MDIPLAGEVLSLEQFVERQEKHVARAVSMLNARSLEIENAVRDLVGVILKHPLERGVAVSSYPHCTNIAVKEDWKGVLCMKTENAYQSLCVRYFSS